jgi:hypothetical protein
MQIAGHAIYPSYARDLIVTFNPSISIYATTLYTLALMLRQSGNSARHARKRIFRAEVPETERSQYPEVVRNTSFTKEAVLCSWCYSTGRFRVLPTKPNHQQRLFLGWAVTTCLIVIIHCTALFWKERFDPPTSPVQGRGRSPKLHFKAEALFTMLLWQAGS